MLRLQQVLLTTLFVIVGFAQSLPPTINWQKCIGGNRSEACQSVLQLSDGHLLAAGYCMSSDGDLRGCFMRGEFDAMAVKLDSMREIEWINTYGGSETETFYSSLECYEGGYIFAGLTNSDDCEVVGWHEPTTGSSSGIFSPVTDAWLVKTDNIGHLEWQRCIGGGGEDEFLSIINTSDSG